MMPRLPLALAAAALIALSACDIRYDVEPAEELVSLCQPVIFEEVPLTHCRAIPGEQAISTDWAPENEDRPFGSLRAFMEADTAEPKPPIILAMNGGAFGEGGEPTGYLVEDNRRLTVLNQRRGEGAFYLRPNGVFFGQSAAGPWFVWPTQRFARDNAGRPEFATQSGPMLVIDGELNSDIDPIGGETAVRNAVGIDDLGRAHFVISEAPISMGKLARYYRDVLNAENALHLDAGVSQIWDPAEGRLDAGQPIGPLIVVRNQAEATP